ncbi:CDP-diacylglycerol--serine O-phosphatidyltransferase [uncultured Thiothrix sp.]|uniref:CDP-diacylglycerol--serine O-phosphatidyltransferase n=1 Tax=uncultured Thiothrix sp. TaxID=223185 RepID=UPI0026069788|nr:CDP-diacylglycerol--serine O-phosphatidyltransferase [uncultured Thiothrix sp.]HMT92806.1 CDP-diacylglycerol--serine O-phosphatidyltransferase [Thiolinea sp.]
MEPENQAVSSEPNATPERPRSRGIYLLPNLFTTAAMFSGFYAIVAAMQGHFEAAAIAIFISMVLDGLDGRVARLTNTQTAFGAEYDSMSDLISFGVAPGLTMYQWSLVHFGEMGTGWGKVGWLAAFVYVACAALRLARFNTHLGKGDKKYFTGLPSPTAAALLAGMVWVFNDLSISGNNFQFPALLMTLTAGLLMVSNVSYYSFKEIDLRNRVPFVVMIAVLLLFALTTIDPPKVLFTVFVAYTLSGPIIWGIRRYRRMQRRKKEGQITPPTPPQL